MEIFPIVGIVIEMLVRGISGEMINRPKRLRPQAIIIAKNNDM